MSYNIFFDTISCIFAKIIVSLRKFFTKKLS